MLPDRFSFWKGDSLPDESLFKTYKEVQEEHITDKQLTSACWFESISDDFTGKVYEQTYFQKNGYAITLISVE